MNAKNRIVQQYGLWILDMICIALSYWIATNLRFAGNNDWGSKTLHYAVLVVFLLFYTIYGFFAEWNRDFLNRGLFRELMSILQFNGVMILASLTFVFFVQWSRILSRQVILNFIWINLVLMYVCHIVFKEALRKVVTGEKEVTKVLVVALPELVDETITKLRQELGMAYQIVGSASVRCGRNADEEEREESFRMMTEKLTQIPFDEVFINTPGLSKEDVQPLIEGFEKMGVVCRYNLGLPELNGSSVKVESFGSFTTVTYMRFQSSYKRLIIKRLFDILGGLVGVLLTGILTLFIAPAIKLDSPGPVFFAQTRIGKNGRRFKIYKFRSMYQDAEQRKKELEKENEVKGLMFKMDNDPRITKVGAFLRSTSLDEFPQFLNVLKGDMSLVGTRPPTEDEFEHYDEHYRRRLSMTPGLTGMWQVSGRSDISDFDEVVRLDLEYIDNWSLTLDFKILLQTVVVVLGHRGAK
jgi:exopolysaccharide biosynthesis polyprenyl glycosylphosphotransferase